jgi:trk system potassium uptake protein TrkA
MYYVIVGGNKLAQFLTKILLEEDHKVVVIEKDEALAKKIAEDLDVVVIIDDPTNPKTLLDADVDGADYVVVLTDSDDTNLVTALLAKEHGAKKVAVRLSKIYYNDDNISKLGVDLILHPESMMASYAAEMLTKPTLIDLAFFTKGDAEILEYSAKDKNLVNKQIKDIKLPANATIFALYDLKGKLIIPKPNTVIKNGYKVLILAETESAKILRKAIA